MQYIVHINTVDSSDTSPVKSLDIGLWNCNHLSGQKLQKKTFNLSDEKSISFCTWDFSRDVSNAVLLFK